MLTNFKSFYTWCGWGIALLAAAASQPACLAQSLTLGEALNATNLVWTTGGNYVEGEGTTLWSPTLLDTHDGIGAARCYCPEDGMGWLQTTVNGSGTLTFWWYLYHSRYAHDYILTFKTNDVVVYTTPKTSGWVKHTIRLSSGPQILQWVVSEGRGYSASAYLDEVVFEPDVPTPPQITKQSPDRTQTALTTFSFTAEVSGWPAPSFQWCKNGIPLTDGGRFSGVTTTNLTISSLTLSEEGYYSISASNAYGVAISSDITLRVIPAEVVGWGDNYSGQTAIPESLTNVVAIAAANWHSLALKADGRVVAWGSNDYGQTNVPSGMENVVAIAAGNVRSLAVTANGQVTAWGSDTYVPSDLNNVVEVAAGESHSLALRADGTVVGWGGGFYGECSPPEDLNDAVAIAAGNNFSLALRANGQVVGWGDDYAGKVSRATNLSNVIAIATGRNHCLALTAAGQVLGWGFNNDGEVAIPESLSNAVAIAAGNSRSLAFTADGQFAAWGLENAVTNEFSQVAALVASAGYAGSGHNLALVGREPGIFTPPANTFVAPGANASLLVRAVGALPLHYRWQCNGTNLVEDGRFTGTTSRRLTIRDARVSDGGYYSVVVSNALGCVTSTNALVEVATLLDYEVWGGNHLPSPFNGFYGLGLDPLGYVRLPRIGDSPTFIGDYAIYVISARQPTSVDAIRGSDGTFLDSWEYAGNVQEVDNLTGAPDESYATLLADRSFAAFYNPGHWSNVTVLASFPGVAPTLTTELSSQVVELGMDTVFTMTAEGLSPVSYQWFHNIAALAGATNPVLSLTNIQASDAGNYWIVASNAYGTASSSLAYLDVRGDAAGIPPSSLENQVVHYDLRLDGRDQGTVTFDADYCYFDNGNPPEPYYYEQVGPHSFQVINFDPENPETAWSYLLFTYTNLESGVVYDLDGSPQVAGTFHLATSSSSLSWTGSFSVSNGFFQVLLSGPEGAGVVVEKSSDLIHWSALSTNTLPAGGLTPTLPLDANHNQFFRARLLQ